MYKKHEQWADDDDDDENKEVDWVNVYLREDK